MKCSLLVVLTAGLAARDAIAHAIFQQLWVDGVDYGSTCNRLPTSNSPVTNAGSRDVVCNAGTRGVSGKCPVKAGGTVTVEMHQQPGDRSCKSEAIGGAHWGPVQIYLSKDSDASNADGSSGGWFRIFSDAWSKKAGGRVGDDDNWGTRDLDACCGRMDVPTPKDLSSGDYLLRAEALALHTAGQSGGAQSYISCYQITVSGGSSANYATVKFPGAYRASDPGIQINIHAVMNHYVAPGPAVVAGGVTKQAGSGCTGCESTCKAGSSPSAVAPGGKQASGGSEGNAPEVTEPSGGEGSPSTPGACAVAAYGQCGGDGYSGCTQCASGYTCKAVSPPYNSQCAPVS
ncbi:glycosyl hydrolase family 61 domain-containing protein [Neurospora intermedia]|uniref:lytic cellulose monooxygenase (C4-dehydrogenating) n=1 Tax=Neurospora intermedia TaxID=5142 RepID=A0ABR3D804_NEUIN